MRQPNYSPNELRRLLESLGPGEDIPTNELAQIYRPQQGGFIRREDTGETLFVNGQPGGISEQPIGPNDMPAMQQQPQMQRIKVAGYGNGIMSDVGEMEGVAPPIDYARGPVDTPKGRGFYGKDGSVYVKGPDGALTKVILGYDRDASYESAKRNWERRRNEALLANSQADLEHKQEVTAGLRAARDVREDPFTQSALEKRYGKAEKGYQWSPDGKLVPMAGGSVDAQSQGAIETGTDTIRKIDEMIGQRDAQGNLVKDSAPHKGFESAVGVSIPKALGAGFIPGTDTSDFNRRLDEVKGGAFLKAFESLKGGGQITEVEGKKATDAITRMSTAQSEAEFVKAAIEFRGVVERGLQRAQAQRGGPSEAPQQQMGMGEKAQAIFKAKKAIAAGADPSLVKQRLESAGIRDHGL